MTQETQALKATRRSGADLAAKYAAPRPRYTSYPTAPHFHAGIDAGRYRSWLRELKPGSRVSLYTHIPFCDTLCWFCACSTKIVRRYQPIARYLEHLRLEMAQVAALIPPQHAVTHMHWGGGSPDILAAEDILNLACETRRLFHVGPEAEFAVEIDPRALTKEKVTALAEAGLTRASLGVQDFDPVVQAAINRRQSFEITKAAVDQFRAHGVTGVNIDLVYGLPHQTVAGALRTVEQIIGLDPDRLALFGYAHLPARVRHQCLIDTAAVPEAEERFAQAEAMSRRLVEAGYVRIGLDHFAKPADALARKELHRNFQGYTTDAAEALMGFGASAIGQLPQGYVQNAVPIAEYQRCVANGKLATVRGFALSDEDRARAYAIEQLMCNLQFSAQEMRNRFGSAAAGVLADAADLCRSDQDGFLMLEADGFQVTEKGRPFLRSICARLDAYLPHSQAVHSVAV